MRRAIYALIALTVAGVVLGAGLLIAKYSPRLIPNKPGAKILSEWVSKHTGAEVKAGWIAPLAFPGLGIQVRGLELGFAGSSEPFFTAAAIKVVADSSEFFTRRRVVWRQVIVEKPCLRLVRESSGKWNLTRWAKTLKPPEKPKTAEEKGLVRWMIEDSLTKALPADMDELKDFLELHKLTINHAKLSVTDHGPKKKLLAPINLDGVDLKLEGAFLKEPVAFSLSFPFLAPVEGGPGRFSARGSLRLHPDRSVDVNAFTATWAGLTVNRVTGKLRAKSPLNFDLQVDARVSYPSFRQLMMWPPVARSKTIPFTAGHGQAHILARVWGLDPKKPAKVHYRGTAQILDMTFDPGRVIPALEHVNTTIALNDGEVVMPPITTTIAGLTLRGSAKMLEAHDPHFILSTTAAFVDLKRLFPGRKKKLDPNAPMMTMRTSWEGDAVIGEGLYQNLKFVDARGHWSVNQQRRITFGNLFFRACSGTYTESGRSYIDFNHPVKIELRLDGKIADMDVTSFTDQVFHTTTFLHGRFSAEGAVTGNFLSGKFVGRDLSGDLNVTVENGFFKGINLMGSVLNFLHLPPPADLSDQRFDKMTAVARLKSGVAFFDNLYVETADFKAFVKGWIDFPGQKVDLKIKLLTLGNLKKLAQRLPLVGESAGTATEGLTTLYVRATGGWGNLSYSLWSPRNDTPIAPPPELFEPVPGATACDSPEMAPLPAGTTAGAKPP